MKFGRLVDYWNTILTVSLQVWLKIANSEIYKTWQLKLILFSSMLGTCTISFRFFRVTNLEKMGLT